MALIEARDLRSAADVIENVKRTRDYFKSLKPSGNGQRISALEEELRSVKFERDLYRAKCRTLEIEIKNMNLGRLAVLAGPKTIERVQVAVCDFYGLDLTELLARDRHGELVMVRQIAMYLCRKLTKKSTTLIGKMFAGRDHTTVMNAERRIEKKLQSDGQLNEVIEMFIDKLSNEENAA